MDRQTSAAGHAGQLQLLVFHVHGEECAVALTDAREIIPVGTMTPVPAAPTSIRGMVNIRGRVVTVVDLAIVLGLSGQGSGRHIIVAERGSDVFGILVDSVTGVLRINADQLQHAPELVQAKPAARFVKGVVVLDGEHLMKVENSKIDSALPEEKKVESNPAETAEKNSVVSVDQIKTDEAQTPDSRIIVLLDLPGMLNEIGQTPAASPSSSSVSSPASSPSPVSPERHEAH